MHKIQSHEKLSSFKNRKLKKMRKKEHTPQRHRQQLYIFIFHIYVIWWAIRMDSTATVSPTV